MKKATILIFALLLFVTNMYAQSTDVDKQDVKRIADYILDHTEYSFQAIPGRTSYT